MSDMMKVPEVELATPPSPNLMAEAQALVISDDASFQTAVDISRRAQAFRKMVEALLKPAKQAMDAAKKKVLDHEKSLLALVDGPDQIVRLKITEYESAQRRKAADKLREDQAKARREAEEEKLLRAVRLENMAAATGDDEFRKAADQELATPVVTKAVVAPPPPKAEGATFSNKVTVVVTDLRELARAVADGKVPTDAIEAAMPWLRREAIHKGESYDVPGTVRDEQRQLSVRR